MVEYSRSSTCFLWLQSVSENTNHANYGVLEYRARHDRSAERLVDHKASAFKVSGVIVNCVYFKLLILKMGRRT
ncbi:MAG: hypothetical protein CMJ20_04755 [Phycisphaeraceae bacterium]|nr:hypothetical protein [Phycisphaeraceae bacterium]